MSEKMKNGLMVAGGWVVIIGLIFFIIYVMPIVDSWYGGIGEKIPILGRLIDWAESVYR